MRVVRLALLVIAVTLTSSCGNGTGLFDTVSVATAVTPGNVALGDTVRIHVTVTNLSNEQVSPTCLAYFRVVASDGTVVGGDRQFHEVREQFFGLLADALRWVDSGGQAMSNPVPAPLAAPAPAPPAAGGAAPPGS